MGDFSDRYGPWAVVTGAGAGVGLAFAEELARRGVGVVMVDVSADVEAVADSVPGDTRTLVADVADPAWFASLDGLVSGLGIGLAVANAGLSHVGPYLGMDAGTRRRIVELNCTATADLASWVLPRLVERGGGGFVTTSSGSGLAGTAGVALYSATKAFTINLVEAIGWELRDRGVDTLALVAPSMDTPGFRGSEADPDRMAAPAADPAVVVAGALDALPEGGRYLADAGLELVAGVDRRHRVDLLSEATTAMYPDRFPPSPGPA